MKLVKKTSEYTISQRRDSRYAIVDANKKPVNGEEKIKILLAEELIKLTAPAPVAEPEPEEAAAEEVPAEEAPAEDAAK